MNIVRTSLHAIRLWHLGMLAVFVAAGTWAGCKASDSSATASTTGQPAAKGSPVTATPPATADNRKVALLINGEPVYEDDLAAGLPADAFQETLDDARLSRLDRLYRNIPILQFLRRVNIEVSQQEIDADIADLRKNPPAAGCPCCRYESLEQFMKLNYITAPELERMSRSQLGLRKYLDTEWQKVYPTAEARAALLKEKRPDFEKKYTKAYHIFFNEVQDPAFKSDAATVSQKKRKLAEEAWNRLQKGETFEAVAKAMSEDKVSAAQGGFLGFIPKDVFGKAFAEALAQLAPGTYSKPVESTWGYHIIRREAMTDDDLLTILKDDFQGKKATELLDKLDSERKVEQPGKAATKAAVGK
jgi:parvulin-like peptidyl-prolyl isomerase